MPPPPGADNGGPFGSANNFPLKGGKHSNWQGGVRVNAFLSGGALPQAVRGTVSDELITVWDWYATLLRMCASISRCRTRIHAHIRACARARDRYATFVAGIAGADPTDHRVRPMPAPLRTAHRPFSVGYQFGIILERATPYFERSHSTELACLSRVGIGGVL